VETKVVNRPSTYGWHEVPGEGKSLREEWIDSGSESGMTQGEKSSLVREDLGGYLSFNCGKVETHPRPLPIHGGEKNAAFTLAEVLITLAIIGVVATMTIPTLISDYKDRELITKNKKVYSSVIQALNRVKADSSSLRFDDMFGTSETSAEVAQNFSKYFRGAKFLDKPHILKYMQPVQASNGKNTCAGLVPSRTFSTIDDVFISVTSEGSGCNSTTTNYQYNSDGSIKTDSNGNPLTYTQKLPCATITVDVNGKKEPNQFGKDAFSISIMSNNYKFYCTRFYGCIENIIKNDKFYEDIVDYEIGADFTN